MQKIDIKLVGAVVQDFTNRKIDLISKDGSSIWQHYYKSEDTFNRTFLKINKQFLQELSRRDKESIK